MRRLRTPPGDGSRHLSRWPVTRGGFPSLNPHHISVPGRPPETLVGIFAFIAAKPAAVMRKVEAVGTSIQPFAIILLIVTVAGWNCLLCSSPPRS